jgi:hypothetical protein
MDWGEDRAGPINVLLHHDREGHLLRGHHHYLYLVPVKLQAYFSHIKNLQQNSGCDRLTLWTLPAPL